MLGKLTRLMNLAEDEIMHHPHLLVNVFDHEHRVLYWNKRCEQFFGISEKEALGKKIEDLVPAAKDHRNMILLEKALSGENVIVEQEAYDWKSGYYKQTVLPLRNKAGKVIAAVNIVKDIHAPKHPITE